MTHTMRAVVLDAPEPVEDLHVRDLPVPEPAAGWCGQGEGLRSELLRAAHQARPR